MKRLISTIMAMILVMSAVATEAAKVEAFANEMPEIIEVSGNAEHSFGETFSGYLRISADLYLTEKVNSAKMDVCVGGVVAKTKPADTLIKNKWQTVSVYLTPGIADALRFTSNALMLVNNIKVDKIPVTGLVYEEDFEDYSAGENVRAENHTKIYPGRSTVRKTGDGALSEFKVAENIPGNKTKVGTLYYPRFYNGGTSDKYPVKTDDEGKILNPQPQNLPSSYDVIDGQQWLKIPEGMEYYSIPINTLKDKKHVVVELDVYNAANSWDAGTTEIKYENRNKIRDVLTIGVGETDAVHTQATELACVKIGGNAFNLTGRTIDNKVGSGVDKTPSHNILPKTWNKVIYEAKREQYDSNENGIIDEKDKWHVTSTVTYDGITRTNDTYSAYAKDFGRVFLNINYENGGRFYVDNLKVYYLDDIENTYIARYEENFDTENYEIGETPSGFVFSDASSTDTTQYTTFTVQEGFGGNETKFGRLYNRAYTCKDTDVKRYTDNGDVDKNATKVSGGNTEFFSILVPGLEAAATDYVGMKKKTRLSFKYYLAGGAANDVGNVKDSLRVGLIVDSLKTIDYSGVVKLDAISENSAIVWGKTENTEQNVTVNHNLGAKNWIPVEVEIESVCTQTGMSGEGFNNSYFHEVIYKVGDVSQAMNFQSGCYDINRLLLGVAPTCGGIVYIDDIKAETILNEKDFVEELAHYENVYSKSFDLADSYVARVEISGPSLLVYGKNNNSYSYSAKLVNMAGEEQDATVVYSLEGDVPENISLNGNIINVLGELPKDTQINLKAQVQGNEALVATKKITLQNGETYLEDKKRFNVLLGHIDNVYNYAGDKINGSDLLGFAIDRTTKAPGYWLQKENEQEREYMPSDLAALGNFLRAVDAVGYITGDESYNKKVDSIYEEWIDNYLGDNGLPYWGAHSCADMLTGDKAGVLSHELKAHFPYMDPFFRINKKAAQQISIQAWAEHVIDWDNMLFNRHGEYTTSVYENENELLKNTETYTLTKPGYKSVKSTDIGFASIAADLGQLASELVKNSNGYDTVARNAFMKISDAMWKVCDPDPNKLLNVSQNSTAGRYGYPDAAPNIKDISKYEPAAHLNYEWWRLPDISLNHYEITGTGYGDRWWNAYGDDMLAQEFITKEQQWIVRECYSKFAAAEEAYYPFVQWGFVEAAGPETKEGKVVIEKAIRAHANHIRMAYNEDTNEFRRIFIDGTDVTGFEMTRDYYGSTKGAVLNEYDAGYKHLLGTVYNYLNAVKYEEYNDFDAYPEFERDKNILWNYIRNYLDKKGFGNVGTNYPGDGISLNLNKVETDPQIMLSMIYLYQATGINDYLDMARLVGDNIIKSKMADGMFTSLPQNRYIIIGGENGTYPYAFALLEATIRGEEAKVPVYFPNTGFREDAYYDEETNIDYETRYSGDVFNKGYTGIENSLEDFQQIQVRDETKTITFDGNDNISTELSIRVMFVSGSNAEIKAYNNEGEEIYSTMLDSSLKNRGQKITISAPGESIKSISFKTDGLVLVDNMVMEKFYKGEIIYEEDFEDFEEGEAIDTYDVTNYFSKPEYIKSTFTAAKGVGGKEGMSGSIYNGGYYSSKAYRVDDDGKEDGDAEKTNESDGSMDYFSIPVNMDNAPDLRLEFKYYIAGNARVQDINGAAKDSLSVGIVPSNIKHSYASEVAWATISYKTATVNSRLYSENENKFVYNPVNKTTGIEEKEWFDAAFEVKKVRKMVGGEERLCAEFALILNGEKFSSVVEGIEDSSYGNLVFGVECGYGGKVYIDDIKLYSLSDANEDVENILGKNFVNLKGAPYAIAGFNNLEALKAGELSSVVIRKSAEAPSFAKIITGLYKGEILDSYSVNQLDLSGLELYKDTKVNLSEIVTVPENHEGYSVMAMLFESLDSLVPLADKFELK